MGNHFRQPDIFVQFTRRSILKSAPVIAAPMLPAVAVATAKPPNIDDCPPMERVYYHAAQIRKAMKEQCGGEWFSTIDEEYRFVVINHL